MYHYQPLKDFLAAQGDRSISLTYDDIERLLGRPLPPSAKGEISRQWWANTNSHSQARAWLSLGRKAKLNLEGPTVTFSRPAAFPASSDSITVGKHDLTPAALRLLEAVAEKNGISLEAVAAAFINSAAAARQRNTLDWFSDHTQPSNASAADLIRADRDAR